MTYPSFHQRVAIMSSLGQQIRHVPGAMASAMVSGGAAVITDRSIGRIRSVVLVRTADTSAQRVGPPTGHALGVQFYRWQRLDESASRIVQHHPRCLYD